MPTLPVTRQEVPRSAKDALTINRNTLAEAFESFSHVAGSLEHSYAILQGEVARLRHELEVRNGDLARSLAENQRMRLYLSGLLDDMPCGVLAVDRNFRPQYANPCAIALFLADPEAPNSSISPALRAVLQDVAVAGVERTWILETKEGPRPVAVSAVTRPRVPGAVGEMVFILRDVSEQKRLEEERELAHRMKALAEMTALLAHEIRNPLGSLELFAGLIKEASQEQSEVAQWIVHIQAGLRALSATVNNVLQFHSLAPSQLKPVNAIRLVAATAEFLEPLALQRGMGIEVIAPSEELLISADPDRLQQVFFNLAINAFRAMPAGKILRIRLGSAERSGGNVARIDFEDQGCGIPPEQISRVFDAGFSTQRSSPGLGLAVCKRITAQHQGEIGIQSKLGAGTTVSLYLPLLGTGA